MSTTRKIASPGIQISETDLSLGPVTITGTTVFVPGFAAQGPVNLPLTVASLSEYQQIFGLPTNGAERYFYNTVKAVFQSPANVMVTRLPYGEAAQANTVGLLAYPAVFVDTSVSNTDTDSLTATSAQNFSQATSGTWILGAPSHYNLTQSQFAQFQNGSLFSYNDTYGTLNSDLSSLGNAALIITNPSTTNIDGLYEGYYIGVADNTNLNPATQHNTISKIYSLNTSASYVGSSYYQNVPSARYGFALSANSGDNGTEGSVSEVLEQGIVGYNTYTSRSFDDTIIIGLFKLQQSVFSTNSIELGFSIIEGYTGSLDSKRLVNAPNGGPPVSFFIENQVNNASANLTIRVNPFLSRVGGGTTYLQPNGIPNIKIRFSNPTTWTSTLFDNSNPNASANRLAYLGFNNVAVQQGIAQQIGETNAIYPLGTFYNPDMTTKIIGNVPLKLETVLDQLLNPDTHALDVFCEAGLGTIYACSSGGTTAFDDYQYVDVSALSSFNGSPVETPLVQNYQTVANIIDGFIENPARKDMIGILDPLMPILVQSNSVKTINDPDLVGFTSNILWPLMNQFAPFNSSYLCTYATAVQVGDDASGKQVWVPFSGFAAAAMANTDSNFEPWFAPAGLTRGLVKGVNDIAYYPRQKQRDQLYNANFNPVAFFPSDGFVIYGEKTMLNAPSAFSRINVRRLFLNLETATRATLKYYVFEPNTLFTRTQIINVLTPIFENAKNTEGVYDYLIICDERNNTPAVIDDNTLVCDIYLKPVRTAEFILANFYATATSVNFQELVS